MKTKLRYLRNLITGHWEQCPASRKHYWRFGREPLDGCNPDGPATTGELVRYCCQRGVGHFGKCRDVLNWKF